MMSDRNITSDQELESLRQEVATLKREKATFEFQQKLLENLVEIEHSPSALKVKF